MSRSPRCTSGAAAIRLSVALSPTELAHLDAALGKLQRTCVTVQNRSDLVRAALQPHRLEKVVADYSQYISLRRDDGPR